MAHFFTNENPNLVQNTTGNYGAIPAGIDATKIEDGLTGRGAGLGKLGSSIPSPLARLFLFSAALSEVNSRENANQGQGHDGVLNQQTNKIEPTPYHDLVGELLDMLEFVFQYGDHPNFHVKTWSVNDDCAALDASAATGHKNLSAALKDAFTFGVLKDNPVIHLFTWHNDVIGGSSPISLVYTSANLRNTLAQSNAPFSGVNGNKLFDDSQPPVPLHGRGNAFKEYLYRLLFTDMQGINATHPLHHLKTYIQDSGSNYDKGIYANVQNAPDAYTKVKDLSSQGAAITVAGVQLRVSDHTVVINNTTCGYLLAPTSDVYKHGNKNQDVPLALTKNGVTGLVYANGRAWQPQNDCIPVALNTDIYSRQLPSLVGKKYPFLTVDDFFEDKVIELSYKVNSKRFYTGRSDIPFLLPLKKIFFEYFHAEDLATMLTMDYDSQRDTLNIDLKLPLVNGHSITMHKKYDVSDNSAAKVDCIDGGNTVALAIFPFYRLSALDENVYNVMLGASAQGATLKFYEPKSNTQVMNEIKCDNKQRMNKANYVALSTYHYHIDGAFTFCELALADTTALIVPKFEDIDSDPTKANKEFTFAFDFGTTNTHVAYAETTPGQLFGKKSIKPFTYDDSDTQMVRLDGTGGIGEFSAFITAVKRELVPEKIGKSNNNEVEFPMRTATYQSEGNPIKLEMFFNTNIGFNYGEDISQLNSYHTNIKWDRFDLLAPDRMKTFFAQMLWMMKNKSVLNDGSATFTLVVTYPYAMRANDVQMIKDAWNDAKNEVHCNVNIKYLIESVAPYYSYLLDLNYGVPYANMDIGGGTTDFLYVNPRNNDNHVFSAFFAANDLWNDGIDKAALASKANGFLTYYTNKNVAVSGKKATEMGNVRDKASSSADIVSYLFANDSDMHFSGTIRTSPKMMQLPIVHFSALAFYMAYALHMAEVDIPQTISFTGMGSKYIKFISAADSDISKILTAVFHYAGKVLDNDKLRAAKIEVTFAPRPKEVTAEGALLSLLYKDIEPNKDIYFGYETEDPGATMYYDDITDDILNGVKQLYDKFLKIFDEREYIDVLSTIGNTIDKEVVKKLRQYCSPSMLQMNDLSSDGQDGRCKFTEPMFFWPLKNALYVIGKELATNA